MDRVSFGSVASDIMPPPPFPHSKHGPATINDFYKVILVIDGHEKYENIIICQMTLRAYTIVERKHAMKKQGEK